jgi:hypothetical protein
LEAPPILEIINAPPQESVMAVISQLKHLSAETRSHLAPSLSQVIAGFARTTDNDSALGNSIHLAYALELPVHAHVLSSIVADDERPLALRRAALAAMSFTNIAAEFWEGIDTHQVPEFAPVVAKQLIEASPIRALTVISDISGAVTTQAIHRLAEATLKKIHPAAASDVHNILQAASGYVQPILRSLLATEELRARFGFLPADSIVVLEGENRRALSALTKRIAAEGWVALHQYSGYYEGRLFAHASSELPPPIARFVQHQLRIIAEHARSLGMEPPAGGPLLSNRAPGAMRSMVDSVKALEILQTDPVFDTDDRRKEATMVGVGRAEALSLLVPEQHHAVVRAGIASDLGRNERLPLGRVLLFAIEAGFELIVQPGTAVLEELTRHLRALSERQKERAGEVFNEVKKTSTIRNELLNSSTTGGATPSLAVVDFLVTENVREGFGKRIRVIPARYDLPLTVGYMVPWADLEYQRMIEDAIKVALRTQRGSWKSDFQRLMKHAGVILNPDGPDIHPMSDSSGLRIMRSAITVQSHDKMSA